MEFLRPERSMQPKQLTCVTVLQERLVYKDLRVQRALRVLKEHKAQQEV
jgi:hypothetical protein